MTTLNAFVWNQQKLGYVPHTSVSGEVFQPIKRGTTTGSGAADGTTLIDTNGDSSGANAYNGKYWVRIMSDVSKGEWRRVVDDDGAGTLTLEGSGNGFENQIVPGVEYEIWKGPEAIINVTASSGATDVRDSTRTEADDYWIGYYICVISGSKRGQKALITDSTSSGGIFVVDTGLSGALTVGDVCVIRKFIEVEGLSVNLSEQYNPKPMSRIDFAEGDGVVGARGGTVSFKVPAMASNSLSAATYKAASNPLQGLLTACGLDEIVGTSCTVAAGSSTTSINISTAQWENLVRPGGMVIWNGNPTFVTDLTDGGGSADNVTVSPALPNAPAASDVLYATRSYFKNTTGTNYGVTLEWELDGIRTTLFGCKGTVSIEAGPIVMFNFNFNIDHWVREKEIAPYTAGTMYSTAPMIQAHDQRAWLSATATSIGQFTASIDAETAPRGVNGALGVNGRAGFQQVKGAGSCTFREIPNADTAGLQQIKRFEQRTSKDVIVAWGSHGNTIGVRIPVAMPVESSHPQDNGGIVEVPLVLKAQDAGQISYGSSNGTTSKMPDFCIAIS
jgi:hypothetical protein